MKSNRDLAPCLRQFVHINRYDDPVNNCVAAKILPGEYYVTMQDEMITTVLGSCVSACIYDPLTGIGGMNHFMLPTAPDGLVSNQALGEQPATRFGFQAMEGLINDILKCGVRRRDLRVKLFGGARVIHGVADIGRQNIRFVREYLRIEGMTVESYDLGMTYPRKVNFFPRTGRALVKRLAALHNETIIRREAEYHDQLRDGNPAVDIEFF